ncbi:AAA family ATPase [Ramlibacter sp.]|uniref:AAA family ATPase n=1 Tax=Ramlibacter sp. TaxID=1917967 RepID=UPI003D14904F
MRTPGLRPDLPLYPPPPEAPVGREPELARLRESFDAVAGGVRRVVLVAGAAGVGKSFLVQQLRPLAESQGVRYVAGKFEQRNERETTALLQALGSLGRLLLAEDADTRADARGRILRGLGAHAGLARVVPEFAELLTDVPEPRAVDPAQAAARMAEVVAGLLRAIATPADPLVFVLDDLQWGGTMSIRLIDAVLGTAEISGLMLVAAFRDDDLAEDHPLVPALSRWTEDDSAAVMVRVANLRPPQVAQLLARRAGLPPAPAIRLAHTLAEHARGNPYETVELLDALREAGLLEGEGECADWDDEAVGAFLTRHGVKEVVAARIGRLPSSARQLLQTLACLGMQTPRQAARTAAGMGPGEFEIALALLRRCEFILPGTGHDGPLRLRHDRVQQAAYSSLPQDSRGRFHLGLARRLALDPALAAAAADQYVWAVDDVPAGAEGLRAAALLRESAAQARLLGNHEASYRLQNAALCLVEAAEATPHADPVALATCEIDYHVALCSIGRPAEADAIFRRIVARHRNPLARIDADCAQVSSLANRDRMDEAVALGLAVLRELGIVAPADLAGEPDFDDSYQRLRRWVDRFDLSREATRAEPADARVVASAKMIAGLVSAAFHYDVKLLAWLTFQAQALWERHGPCAPLVVSFSRASSVSILLRQDWRTGYLAATQALELCETRGWEPEASQVRFVYALGMHWIEPLERPLAETERAREGLLAGGDLRNASFGWRHVAQCVFECGPSLRRYAEELEGAFALSRRADNRQSIGRCLADRRMLRALLGDGAYPGSLDSHRESEARYLVEEAHPWLAAYHASTQAIICAIFADAEGLARNARRALSRRNSGESLYPVVWPRWLSGLAAAWELRSGSGSGSAEALAELQEHIEWMRQRAIDTPFNFRHLHLHLLAEREWALGEPENAVRHFDEALGALEFTHRPWHQALICERAARLQLEQGWAHSGGALLLEAQQLYASWGATAKVALLAAETGAAAVDRRQPASHEARREPLDADDLDTLAVLRAAQALATERNPARLKTRVEDLLAGIAGATDVTLAVWDEALDDWALRDADGKVVAATSAPQRVPLTCMRYAFRTREPLLVNDVMADARFAADLRFRGLERCSLLVMPVLQQAQAILVLENRASRGAFGRDRLSAVATIAAQLAVSLESAGLYERLQRKVSQQTRELRDAQALLVAEARRAGMAQIATNVLHNVGNVLTSVNVSAHVLIDRVRMSRASRIGDLAQLLESHAGQVGETLFGRGGKGWLLPRYVRQLAEALAVEREGLLAEIERLGASVDHIRNVVAIQQTYAGSAINGGPLPDDAPFVEPLACG